MTNGTLESLRCPDCKSIYGTSRGDGRSHRDEACGGIYRPIPYYSLTRAQRALLRYTIREGANVGTKDVTVVDMSSLPYPRIDCPDCHVFYLREGHPAGPCGGVFPSEEMVFVASNGMRTSVWRKRVTVSPAREPKPVTKSPVLVTESQPVTESVTENTDKWELAVSDAEAVTRKRGRPAKSDAKSHAERQRAYRQKKEGR